MERRERGGDAVSIRRGRAGELRAEEVGERERGERERESENEWKSKMFKAPIATANAPSLAGAPPTAS